MEKAKDIKNYCWLLLRSSLGEFHVIVPELISFAHDKNLELRISFLNDKIEKQFFANSLYKKLVESYFEVVERRNIISFARRNRNNIKYLFRELSRINQYSIVRSLKILLPDTKLILFPHAFAFHVSETFTDFKTLVIPENNKFEDCVDAFIIFTHADKDYFSKRFPPNIITVFTPRGLNEKWLTELNSLFPQSEIENLEKKYPKRVLLTIRHPHPIYLSEENYFQLLREIIEVAKKFGYELFLKPHPRQNITDFEEYCNSNDLKIWTKDNYTSALFFKYVITFWSSASIDFAAFAIPSIEHFRYEKYHNQLIDKNGKLSSLYVNLGLSLPSTNQRELEIAFKEMIQNSDNLGYKQQRNLKETYKHPELDLKKIKFRKSKTFSLVDKLKHLARLNYYILKNK